jgi:DNA gyrase subunit B
MKPLNSWECDQNKVLSNNELSDLAIALGTGLFRDTMSEVEVENALHRLKYHKIIILADSDIDGSHIECLLLGHLFRHMCPLIEYGFIYIGLPPLYRITEKGKHTFLKDAKMLERYFQKRAEKTIGKIDDLIKLAGKADKIKALFENIAESSGINLNDLSQSLQALISYDSEREDWLMAFAEKILEFRSVNCEGVEAHQLENDAIIISGLDDQKRYFTTIVNEDFYQYSFKIWTHLNELIKDEEYLIKLLESNLIFNNEIPYNNIYTLVSEIEKIIWKGLSLNRAKGLGEMQAEELGETTLDKDSRQLVRVTVQDFNSAGEFIGNMLTTSKVDSRRELLKNFELEKELVDI